MAISRQGEEGGGGGISSRRFGLVHPLACGVREAPASLAEAVEPDREAWLGMVFGASELDLAARQD